MSFNCSAAPEGARKVVDYFVGVLDEEYRDMGEVWQEYCDEMTRLALDVTDVLAACLGLGRGALRGFFAGDASQMRLNRYPPCQQPHLTLGTGPHHDPTSLTLLHQDDVGGLEVFTGGAWHAVRPRSDAFVVNIGDTFSALTNGRHISCLHRAVVNSSLTRRSLTFFLSPQLDRLVAPPVAVPSLPPAARAGPASSRRRPSCSPLTAARARTRTSLGVNSSSSRRSTTALTGGPWMPSPLGSIRAAKARRETGQKRNQKHLKTTDLSKRIISKKYLKITEETNGQTDIRGWKRKMRSHMTKKEREMVYYRISITHQSTHKS
uniref:Uncharacterized protein n=1 Tax=Aegilops tauschii TaxID=37682 RepID=M8AYD4_AEGTA